MKNYFLYLKKSYLATEYSIFSLKFWLNIQYLDKPLFIPSLILLKKILYLKFGIVFVLLIFFNKNEM